MKDTNYATKDLSNYQAYLKDTGKATNTLSDITKSASVAIKTLGAAIGSIAINWAISEFIGFAITSIDNYIHQIDIAADKAKESANAYSEITNELENINNELDNTRSRIDELNAKPNLSFTEQEELERLQKVNEELERQLKLKQSEQNVAGKTARDDALKYLNSEEKYAKYNGIIHDDYGNIEFSGRTTESLNQVDILHNELIEYQELVKEFEIEEAKLKDMQLLPNFDKNSLNYQNAQARVDMLSESISHLQNEISTDLSNISSFKESLDLEKDSDLINSINEAQDLFNNVFNNSKENVTDNFNEIWESADFESTRKELESLAKSGELSSDVIESNKKYQELLEATGKTADEVVSHINSLAEAENKVGENDPTPSNSYDATISQLEKMSDAFDALNNAYTNFKNDDSQINFDNISSLNESFSDLSGIENYIKAIIDAKGNVEETQTAFDNLLSAYLNQTGILRQITDENKNLITSYLEEKGVANAASLAESALAANKRIATIDTENLTKEVMDEIVALSDEGRELDSVTAQIYAYMLEKLNANNVALSTAGDIQNIMALVSACGTGISALQALANAKNGIFSSIASGSPKLGDTYGGLTKGEAASMTIASTTGRLPAVGSKSFSDFKSGIKKQEAYMNDVTSAAQQEIDSAMAKLAGITQVSSNGGGGAAKGSGGGGGGGKSAKEATEEIFDWIETLIKRTDEKIAKLQKKATNAKGWQAKNKLQDSVFDELNKKLVGLQQQYERYMQEANSVGLSDVYIDKIQNGMLDIESITDESIKKMIQDYQTWYDKAKSCEDAIDDVNDSIRETREIKLDNIINDYDKLVSLMKSYTDYRNKLIDIRDRMGENPTQDDYQDLIYEQEDIYSKLQEEYNTLKNELYSGGIERGSDKWREMQQELVDIQTEMLDCADAVEDFKDKIFELRFKPLEDLADRLGALNNQLDNMLTLIGNDNLTKDGLLTDRGLATVGIYGQQLINAKKEAEEYKQAIKALDATYENGDITLDEYNDKLYEYRDAQQQAAIATKEARDAIISLREQAIEEEIDYMNDLIDKKKELLDAEEDLYEYQKKIAEDNKSIAALERQIAVLSLSTNRSDIAQRLQLEEELAEARKNLAEYQHDHDVDTQKDALDQQAEDYEKAKRDEIENLKTNLDAQDALIEQYLGQVRDNYQTVYGVLTEYADAYNMDVTEDLTNPFSSAEAATQSFTDAFSDMVSSIQYQIDSIDWSNLTNGLDGLDGSGIASGSGGGNYEDITGQGKWQKGKNGKWWYGEEPTDDGNYWYAQDGYYNINGKTYGFDEDGYMRTEWDDSQGDWHYFDVSSGAMQTSTWIKGKGSKWYYLDKNGDMVTDAAVKSKDGDGYYYLDDNGEWDESDGKLTKKQLDELGYEVAYAKGTRNAKRGRAKVNENGYELMTTSQGDLIDLKGGEQILTDNQRQMLYEFSKNPTKMMNEILNEGLRNMNFDGFNPFSSLRNSNDNNVITRSDGINVENSVIVQGDASERTIGLINDALNDFSNNRMVKELDKAIRYRMT